jgi:hypothetical protein
MKKLKRALVLFLDLTEKEKFPTKSKESIFQ